MGSGRRDGAFGGEGQGAQTDGIRGRWGKAPLLGSSLTPCPLPSGIRHAEELSLLRAPEEKDKKKRKGPVLGTEDDFDLSGVVLPASECGRRGWAGACECAFLRVLG